MHGTNEKAAVRRLDKDMRRKLFDEAKLQPKLEIYGSNQPFPSRARRINTADDLRAVRYWWFKVNGERCFPPSWFLHMFHKPQAPNEPLSNEEVMKTIRDCVAEGRIDIDLPPALPVPIEVNGYTFTAMYLSDTWSRPDSVGFIIKWACKTKIRGFGELTFYRHPPKGPLRCQNEMLNREFVEAALTAFARHVKLDDEKVQ